MYIHTDGLGSPVAKSDKNGNLISGSRTRYEPYGAIAAGATPTIGFTGHVNDANTGLVYMQQRYYDPYAGRFLSTDPELTDTATGSSFNRYIYAKNSPFTYIDPDGRQARGIEVNCQVGNCYTTGEGVNWANVDAQLKQSRHNTIASVPFIGPELAVYVKDTLSFLDPMQAVADAIRSAQKGEFIGAAVAAGTLGKGGAVKKAAGEVADLSHHSKEFSGALSKAVAWLDGHGFSAAKVNYGKFGDNAGKPIGMQTLDGKVGFRVEYDERHGAHINVWAGKEKGRPFTFDASSKTVDKIVKLFQ
jgi:RHS repeat-associated protein